MKKTFSAKYHAENSTFNKNDLERLERILTDETEDGLKIRSITIYFAEASVEISSFSDLDPTELEDFKENPRHIDITAYSSDKNGETSRFVSIDLWRGSAEFIIRGSDHKWVLGTKEQLRTFIKTKTRWDYVVFLQIFLALLSMPVIFVSTNMFLNERNLAALGLSLTWVACLILSIVLSIWNVYKRPSRIHLKPTKTSKTNWSLVVGIAGLLLTAAGVLISYMSFAQDKSRLP